VKAAHIKDLSRGFGRAVSHFRSERYATVEMLAKASDVGESHIAQMESGVREPTLSQFLRLVLALHVAPGHLFNRAVVEWRDDQVSRCHRIGLVLITRGYFALRGLPSVE
jgi:transcriptional regulator with XRE-family HTH domain